jgi:hypothetical protein
MTAKTPKRPRDPNQLAKLMVDIARGEVDEIKPQEKADVRQRTSTKSHKDRQPFPE